MKKNKVERVKNLLLDMQHKELEELVTNLKRDYGVEMIFNLPNLAIERFFEEHHATLRKLSSLVPFPKP